MRHEFHTESEPETIDIHPVLARAFGYGEISDDREYTTDWGCVFKFDLEKVDIGTTEPYNVWVLSAYLDRGKMNADDHS